MQAEEKPKAVLNPSATSTCAVIGLGPAVLVGQQTAADPMPRGVEVVSMARRMYIATGSGAGAKEDELGDGGEAGSAALEQRLPEKKAKSDSVVISES